MRLFNEAYALLVGLHPFIMGTSFGLSVVASILFLRFYRKTSDRLFLFFSGAFVLMACNRIAFQAATGASESQPALYLVRFLAYCLIIYAIVDKNRGRLKSSL